MFTYLITTAPTADREAAAFPFIGSTPSISIVTHSSFLAAAANVATNRESTHHTEFIDVPLPPAKGASPLTIPPAPSLDAPIAIGTLFYELRAIRP